MFIPLATAARVKYSAACSVGFDLSINDGRL